jgi:hypothetical protein
MIVAVDFTHFDLIMHEGDEIADDDPLVALAPHLFVQPDPVPEAEAVEVRICGPLVENPAPGVDPVPLVGESSPELVTLPPDTTVLSPVAVGMFGAVAQDEIPAPDPATEVDEPTPVDTEPETTETPEPSSDPLNTENKEA